VSGTEVEALLEASRSPKYRASSWQQLRPLDRLVVKVGDAWVPQHLNQVLRLSAEEYPPDEPRMGGEAGGLASWGHEQSNKRALDRATSKASPLGSGARRTEHDGAGA
jgi:hypothetical protein